MRTRLPEILEKAASGYKMLDAAARPLCKGPRGESRYPHSRDPRTGLPAMHGVRSWTSGHYAGTLWLLFEATGDGFFKDAAEFWTEPLAVNAKVTDNHDIGFIMNCSFGNARRIGGASCDGLLLQATESLSKRFHSQLGLIRSWGAIGDKSSFLVIPDNMMNLELLELAAKMPDGNGRFDQIARSYADTTMKHHFRPDGGAYHVLDYNQRDGDISAMPARAFAKAKQDLFKDRRKSFDC